MIYVMLLSKLGMFLHHLCMYSFYNTIKVILLKLAVVSSQGENKVQLI